MVILNEGDRVVYHYPADEEIFVKMDGVWYHVTAMRDENIISDIESGYAEKI